MKTYKEFIIEVNERKNKEQENGMRKPRPLSVNVEVMYNTYVGDPREVVPLANMNQAVELVRSNKSSEKSEEEIRKDLTSLSAIAVAVSKETKKTSGIVTLRKPTPERKEKLFSEAGADELADEYIFELDNIEVAEKERGKGLAHHLVNRLLGLRNSRAHTIYCSTNSDEVANMLGAYRFSRIGDKNEKPYLLGLM